MKSKLTATLLAFLLGGMGIHRFYLGQHKKGLFYLLFCWTFVPFAISIIDGIAFSFMNYSSFNLKYNLGHTFRKKFENDEAILKFNFDEKLEKEFLQRLDEIENRETLEEYLLNAKARGEYLPRAAYTKACTILGERKNIYNRELDIQ